MMQPTFARARRIAAALVFFAAKAAQVHAQAAPSPLVVKWNNGLDIGTADGANDFLIGTLIELDGRFGLDDPLHEVNDTFVMRRVRPIFQGRTERTLVTNLVPNRDVGIQVQGEAAGLVSHIAGVMNGILGRLTVRPFNRTKNAALRGFGAAVGATAGVEHGPLPSYRSTAQQTFFSYATTAAADGMRTRVSPSAFYYYKSFGAIAEYAHNTEAVQGPTVVADLTHTAWEVTGSYVVTGEPTSDRGVIPAKPFDPALHRWGALQVVARHSRINLDPTAFTTGLASTTSSRTASATGVAALLFRLQLNLQPNL